MSVKDLINWGELSRMLTGDRMNIRKNRIPQKHIPAVDILIKYLQAWKKGIENNNNTKKENNDNN